MVNLVLPLKANYSLLIREPVGGPPRHIPQCRSFKITTDRSPGGWMQRKKKKKDSQNVTNLRFLQTGKRKSQVIPESTQPVRASVFPVQTQNLRDAGGGSRKCTYKTEMETIKTQM